MGSYGRGVRVKLSVSVTEAVRDSVVRMAAIEHRSRSSAVEVLLNEALESRRMAPERVEEPQRGLGPALGRHEAASAALSGSEAAVPR